MLSDKQIRSLEYFQNKMVTFFTTSINRNFNEEQSINYFVGKLVKLDDFGIWYEHPASKCMTFIFYDKILSIAEEQVIAEEEEKSQNITEQVNVARIEEPKTINIPQKIDVVVGAEHLQDKIIDLPDSVDEFREFISSS
jgi:hypothetical protein